MRRLEGTPRGMATMISAWTTHVRTAATALDGAIAAAAAGNGGAIGGRLDDAGRALGLASSGAATDLLASDGARSILRSAAGHVDDGRLLLHGGATGGTSLDSTLRSARFAVDLLMPG